MSKSQMKIGFEMGSHNHLNWRHPNSPRYPGTNFLLYKEHALIAERAKADFAFLADVVQGPDEVSPPSLMDRFESVAIMGALAAATTNIGIIGTVSTTFTEPFNLARQILSVDHISNGRAGWNLVTTDPKGAAANYGREELKHQERYKIANEYLDAVEGLWDSFEDDALIQDKQQNIFLSPGKLHPLNHKGQYYQIKGPLNSHRSIQGRPIIFTATSSEEGKAFAGHRADAVFTFGVGIPECRRVTQDIKTVAAASGREPSDVVIMPNATPVIGRTQEEAEAMLAQQIEAIGVLTVLRKLNRLFIGNDLTQLPLDVPFPVSLLEHIMNGFKGQALRMLEYVRNKQPTVRQFALHFGINYGFDHFVGTPEYVANAMQEWFEQKACDGFVVSECIPGQLRIFAEQVMPILQNRGLVRSEYTGKSLREHLGLKRPENVFLHSQPIKSAT